MLLLERALLVEHVLLVEQHRLGRRRARRRLRLARRLRRQQRRGRRRGGGARGLRWPRLALLRLQERVEGPLPLQLGLR